PWRARGLRRRAGPGDARDRQGRDRRGACPPRGPTARRSRARVRGSRSALADEPGPMTALPLAGVKVLELAQNLAGPFCGEPLARLGADVVKIERPEGGDDARGWGPPFLEGAGTTFHNVNGGKRSVTLDLKDPAAVEWLKDYARGVDVFLQNMRPGALDDLGLGPAALLAINPRLIYCSVSAFGPVGPMKDRPGYGPM